MSIASAITAAQGRVADCYTAISNKGGTLPATQNLANMPTAIGSIPSGGNGIPREVSNGNYQIPSTNSFTFSLPVGVTSIGDYALSFAFNRSTKLTGIDGLSYITSIGQNGMYECCRNCTNFTGSLDFSSLVTINSSGLAYCFISNGITSVDFSSLETVGNYGLQTTFYGCQIPTFNFTLLSSVGAQSFDRSFSSNNVLSSIYFNSLKTSSFTSTNIGCFNGMFNANTASTSGTCTVHFPSNLETTIQGLTGYPLFGGQSGRIVLAFDLPATS